MTRVQERLLSVKMCIRVEEIKIVISWLIHHLFLESYLSPLLNVQDEKKDDETEKCGKGDADRRHWCCPPGGVLKTAAVDDAVIDRHRRSSVLDDRRLLGWMNWRPECIYLLPHFKIRYEAEVWIANVNIPDLSMTFTSICTNVDLQPSWARVLNCMKWHQLHGTIDQCYQKMVVQVWMQPGRELDSISQDPLADCTLRIHSTGLSFG